MHQELFFTSSDNLKLYAQYWEATQPKAIVVLVHGMGEHSNRYQHVAESFCKNQYSFFSFDLRGHGKSEGKKGHTPTYERLMLDIDFAIEKAKEFLGDRPIILYGHSLGGNQVLNYLLRRNTHLLATIVSSPWIRLAFEPPKIKVRLAKIMNTLYGAFTEKSELDASALSSDAQVGIAYKKDPLVHEYVTARMFLQCYEAGNYILEKASKFKAPLLLVHGDQDRLTSYIASTDLHTLNKDAIDLRIWKDGYHELHNEVFKEEYIQYLIDWCNRQVETAQPISSVS